MTADVTDADNMTETASEADLLGAVLAVPDAWWGFAAVGRDDHPGACVRERRSTGEWDLLKGSGAEHRTCYAATEMVVAPTATNGLRKLTVFSLRPRPFRAARVRLLVPERVMGKLSADDVQRLRSEMFRLFGAQGVGAR